MLLQTLANPDVGTSFGVVAKPASPEERDLAVELGRAVLQRRLYKVPYLAIRDDLPNLADDLYRQYGAPSPRLALEQKFADLAGAQRGHVLIHLPRPKMMHKDADVRVRLRGGREVLKLSEWDARHSQRVMAINEAHQALWRLTVYIRPDAAADVPMLERVIALAEDEFGAPSRVNPRPAAAYLNVLFDQFAAEEKWQPNERKVLRTSALTSATTLAEAVADLGARVDAFRAQPDEGVI